MGPECIVLVAASGCLLGRDYFLWLIVFSEMPRISPIEMMWLLKCTCRPDGSSRFGSKPEALLLSHLFLSPEKEERQSCVFLDCSALQRPSRFAGDEKYKRPKNSVVLVFFFLDKLALFWQASPIFFFSSVFTFAFYLHFWVLMTVRSVRSWTGKGYLLNKLKIGIDTSCGI
jgi:hypothetical protein